MHGTRIQELGDGLVVHFRPRRWGEAAFLTFWLLFWTLGGTLAAGEIVQGEDVSAGARMFLLVWLCGWAVGEAVVGVIVAWLLFGHEELTVTPERLELRRRIGRLERLKAYDVKRVDAVRAGRVPSAEDEQERQDFCLLVWYGDERLTVGSGMDEREAVLVASAVNARMRPLGAWGEEVAPPRAAPRATWRDAAVGWVLFVAFLVGVWGIGSLQDERKRPARETHLGRFADPEAYAAAETLLWMKTAVGDPDCDGATWTRWTCRVEIREGEQTVTYLCSPRRVRSSDGRPSYVSTVCWQEGAGPPDDSMFQPQGSGAS